MRSHVEEAKCPNCGIDWKERACVPGGYIFYCGSYYIGQSPREISVACATIKALKGRVEELEAEINKGII